MNFSVKACDITKHSCQSAVIFVHDRKLNSQGEALDTALSQQISKTLKLGLLDKKLGSHAWLSPVTHTTGVKTQRILLIQAGKKALTAADCQTLFDALGNILIASEAKDATLFLESELQIDLATLGYQAAVSLTKASYHYATTKPSAKKKAKNLKITLAHKADKTLSSALTKGAATGKGINLTRELGNLPGNVCTPSYLADQAKQLAKDCSKLTTKILGESQMKKLGMGSLLSVGHGSDEETKLIVMEYKGGKSGDKPHVLVGKGITFDTGGISLKPGPGMDEMKFDMCGAASVFGAVAAIIEMNAKVNLIAVVAAAENMPSGRATKPGDVVTSMSGQTIEVLNTDAEGRLVLCDALTYVERFKPKSVVDIATLTGACVIALGNHATGLYSNDQELADALLASGVNTHDRAWQMPLWDDYQKQLDSNFADIANIGGREGGSITAACFLSRFTQKYKWAHLDIAGTAWHGGARKGATGRPVSLLVDYIINN